MNICNLCREEYGVEYGTKECIAKKQEMDEVLARLGGGMPPTPSSVKYVRVGREEEEKRICDDPHEGMIAVKGSNVGKAFYILADFGFGKSFFLNLITDRAKNMNFVTSTIQIPDIANLADFENIYCQIISNLEYPYKNVKGVSTLLYKIVDHFQTMRQYKDFAIEKGISGHPLWTMLQNMLEVKLSGRLVIHHDTIYFDVDDMINNVSNYLMGETMDAERLWSIGKKGFDNVRKEDTIRYLVNLKKFIIEVGYSGLIIQIDEIAEAMKWTTPSGLTAQLINLHNKVFGEQELSKVMINYVGTSSKWDDLINKTGHGGLIGRYNTGRLPLTELSRWDYINLLTKIIKVYECARGSDLNINKRDIEKFVDISIQKYGTISSLPPRDFINKPFKNEKSVIKLLDKIREGTVDFETIISNAMQIR